MLPEAFVLHKQRGSPQVKYWNAEAENLLKERIYFSEKPPEGDEEPLEGLLVEKPLRSSLSSLMTEEFLLPVKKMSSHVDHEKEN
mmetsp:Transcript_41733/g.63759  ORF Transcript_41733/g.63759 Transcript_41733/m.63759 type:complete len:85 (+) Transcript_41733:80-334(+)